MAPSYTSAELASLSYEDRATFNLLMITSGWAASFPIYPSIPKYRDLLMLQEAAEDAIDNQRGAWAEPMTLTVYEFRMCHKLWDVTRQLVQGKKLSTRERYGWIERYCADMTTREIYEPQDYHNVPAQNRLFIWPRDVPEAVGMMNLNPPG